MWITGQAFGQQLSNVRYATIELHNDSMLLDTLSIIPGSELLFDEKEQLVEDKAYKIDYARSVLYWKGEAPPSRIAFRVYPFSLSIPYQHKNIKHIEPDQDVEESPFIYTIDEEDRDVFNLGGLTKSGSISRGISFGNNQDLSVNSNLDLQLSGKLNDDINILAAISDDNIPIQPEGNTQQLQEFDQVYIQLYNEHAKLTAGDFRMERPTGHFMNFNKRLQGGSFETEFITKKEEKEEDNGIMRAKVSAAVSRGKFSRKVIIGIEGNQGPYRLTGAENELFIVIISGTERIFVDGKLMKRGQDFDYIIDYNAAELTFTANQLVTKDKRIVAEFQYTDRNYARSMVHVNNEYEKGKLKLRVNFYNEQDSKNQPLDVELSTAQKTKLANIGDSLNQAVFNNYQLDSSGNVENQILYKLLEDTLGGDTVFVYSTHPDSAVYRLGFSFVGVGNGNYIQTNSLANGKVYQWIEPDPFTGRPNGSYEPITLIVTPKLRQMATLGGDYQLSKSSSLSFETAFTKNDLNTFSNKDGKDDFGYGFVLRQDNAFPISASKVKPLLLHLGAEYEQIDKNFKEIERFRPVEFDRDWNLVDRGFNEVIRLDTTQRLMTAYTGLSKAGRGAVQYEISSFTSGETYQGLNNKVFGNYAFGNYKISFKGSLLNTTGQVETQFLRQQGSVAKEISWLEVGLIAEQEKSSFLLRDVDSLSEGSFEFRWWEVYVTNADTLANHFRLSYRQREDFDPNSKREKFKRITLGEDVNFEIDLVKNPKHQFRGKVTYRSLKILDTNLSQFEPENTILGKVDYGTNFFKNTISSNTYYEIGSGLEVRKEFSFLEVTPGQGNYYWSKEETDYNNNGVPELNEFEVAQYQDQGNYIRVFTPTNDFVKTFINGFNQVLFIKPESHWSDKKGLRKTLSIFSNKTAYQVNRKTSDEADLYNPFLREVKDTSLISISNSFLNTFYINRTSPIFGVELNYRENSSKTLLTSGFDLRENVERGLRARWSVSRRFMLETAYSQGEKSSLSEFFESRNFTIDYEEIEPKLTYQSGVSFRLSVFFTYLTQQNAEVYGGELSFNRTSGVEVRYNVAAKGSFLATFNYIDILYNGDTRSSLAYEMLDALQPGKNTTWTVSYQRSLNKNMQLSLNYNGRDSEGAKTIHAGGAQVRAFF
jgi:hypothetical protein